MTHVLQLLSSPVFCSWILKERWRLNTMSSLIQLYSAVSFILVVKQFSGETQSLSAERGKSKEIQHKSHLQLSRSSSENKGAGNITGAAATFHKSCAQERSFGRHNHTGQISQVSNRAQQNPPLWVFCSSYLSKFQKLHTALKHLCGFQ